MSLTVFDPIKGCQVLNPKEFTPVINAFHPDYVKTYHPELLASIKAEASQKANGVINGGKSKATREAKSKTVNTINLNQKEFHIYNKAGMPKGVTK